MGAKTRHTQRHNIQTVPSAGTVSRSWGASSQPPTKQTRWPHPHSELSWLITHSVIITSPEPHPSPLLWHHTQVAARGPKRCSTCMGTPAQPSSTGQPHATDAAGAGPALEAADVRSCRRPNCGHRMGVWGIGELVQHLMCCQPEAVPRASTCPALLQCGQGTGGRERDADRLGFRHLCRHVRYVGY